MSRSIYPWLIIMIIMLYQSDIYASQSRTLVAAKQAFKQKDYAKALSLYLSTKDETASTYYNIGTCYYRLNKMSEAKQAFEKASLYIKLQGLSYYNLALIAAKLDQSERVQFWLDKLNKATLNAKLLALGDTLRARVKGSSYIYRWQTVLQIETGSEQNNLFLNDNRDRYKQTRFDLSKLYPNKKSAWILGFGGYKRNYRRFNEFRTANVYFRANRRSSNTLGNNSGIGATYFESKIGDDVYSRTLEISSDWRYRFKQLPWLESSISLAEINSPETLYEGINGHRGRLFVSLDWVETAGLIELSYQFELNNRSSPLYSPTRNKVILKHQLRLTRTLHLKTAVKFRHSQFDNIRSYERRWQIQTRVAWRMNREWIMDFSFHRILNDTDEEKYNYQNNEFGISVSWIT